MRRREFIGLLGGAAAGRSPRARSGARACGALETNKAGQVRLTTFRKTLGDLGWDDTRNVRLDYRWGAGNAGEVKTLAAELVQSAPDVIVASGDLALAELHRLNRKIPIVFTQVSEPVDSGFVASLARPGGNITGFQNLSRRWAGNGWACSRRFAPNVKRVGALFATDAAPHGPFFRAAEKIAPSLGVTLAVVDIQKGFEGAIAAFADQPENGLMAFPHPKTMRAVSWSAHWRHAIGRQ